jgi:hypothetical protein
LTNSCFCSSVSSSMSAWLMLMSAPYWNMVVATGIHLAWSLPIPLRAVARSLSSCVLCVWGGGEAECGKELINEGGDACGRGRGSPCQCVCGLWHAA